MVFTQDWGLSPMVLVFAQRMGRSNRLSVFWTSTALAVLVSCSLNPQPEPPGNAGAEGPGDNAAEGGAMSVVGEAGGSYSVGGMQSFGVGGAAYSIAAGGAINSGTGTNEDVGSRGDASSANGLDAAVDATPDASSSGASPTDSQHN